MKYSLNGSLIKISTATGKRKSGKDGENVDKSGTAFSKLDRRLTFLK
jgi:hypothetical protein